MRATRGGFRRGRGFAALARLGRCSKICGAGLALAAAAAAGPVELAFAPAAQPDDPPDPAAREYWAEVAGPGGGTVLLPAYWAGGDTWKVHARATQPGRYRLGPVSGGPREHRRPVAIQARAAEAVAPAADPAPAVAIDPADPRRFRTAAGRAFVPLGANLAWAPDGTLAYELRGVTAFSRAGLNWMRVWMCHWGGMNLDWLSPKVGPSPAPGHLDERVAERWDRLVEAADREHVYLQVVLQHHGQYDTKNDSNWAENPWNAANPGGFLAGPDDFFTDARARELTRRKYRAIVARWSWSPAIFAWELFNEVHWTDAMRDGHEPEVGRWHDEMADYLRAIDPYHHLITTSTENLHSPVYRRVDFYQPHSYPADLVTALRVFDENPAALDRPVFYGEMGADWLNGRKDANEAGLVLGPAVWASVMGEGAYPAQPWDGWQLVEKDRLAPFAALGRFLAATRLAERTGLAPFSPRTEGGGGAPLEIAPGQYWHRGPAREVDVPADGEIPLAVGRVPAALNGDPAAGVLYRFHLPAPTTATVRVLAREEKSPDGGGFSLALDGADLAQVTLPHTAQAFGGAAVEVPLPAGQHDLVLRQLPGHGYVDIGSIALDRTVSDLAAIGRRGPDFIAAFVWRRRELYAAETPSPAAGALVIEAVPAGSWEAAWWDAAGGGRLGNQVVQHPGGALRVPTPPILRDAAVALTRLGP